MSETEDSQTTPIVDESNIHGTELTAQETVEKIVAAFREDRDKPQLLETLKDESQEQNRQNAFSVNTIGDGLSNVREKASDALETMGNGISSASREISYKIQELGELAVKTAVVTFVAAPIAALVISVAAKGPVETTADFMDGLDNVPTPEEIQCALETSKTLPDVLPSEALGFCMKQTQGR